MHNEAVVIRILLMMNVLMMMMMMVVVVGVMAMVDRATMAYVDIDDVFLLKLEFVA
jgi:hypothetical protein